MADVFAVTRKLVAVYGIKYGQPTFDWAEPEIKAARFGCQGCPAIEASAHAPRSVIARNGKGSPFNDIYAVWFEAREKKNRLYGFKYGRQVVGPLRMETRKRLFARIMDIQRRAKVALVTPEDEAFIRRCWANKVYPRGWSEADEANVAPQLPLFING